MFGCLGCGVDYTLRAVYVSVSLFYCSTAFRFGFIICCLIDVGVWQRLRF